MDHNLTSACNSTKDVLHVSTCLDGAAMDGAAKGKVMMFVTLECFQNLVLNKSPLGVKSEHNQYLLGVAEVDRKTGESYDSLVSMFNGWLIDQINALERGVSGEGCLKGQIDAKKTEYKAAEGRVLLQRKAVASAKLTIRQAKERIAKASARSAEAPENDSVLVQEEVRTPFATR
jgi:hypothetical protein